MHPFVILAPALALLLGQTEPSDAGGEPAAPQESPPAAPAPDPDAKAPPRAAPAAAPHRESPERPAASAHPAEPERTQVASTALAFLDALVAGDAARLAAASAERFSFDGDVRTGKEEIRRAWRDLLAARDPSQHASLLDLELLPTADAVARLGPPPPRLAALAAAKGTWVVIANVSQRPVVLFLAREGPRWAVAGME